MVLSALQMLKHSGNSTTHDLAKGAHYFSAGWPYWLLSLVNNFFYVKKRGGTSVFVVLLAEGCVSISLE